MASVNELIQDFDAGRLVTLITVDSRSIDGSTIYRFTPTTDGAGSSVLFDGETYTPVPMDLEGFEKTTDGPQPNPTVRVSNVSGLLTGDLLALGDLVGALVIRTRTFERFLDTGSEPDTTQTFGNETYRIERKVRHNKVFVEFQLSSILDPQGKQIPGRQMFKRNCRHTYRYYDPNTGEFNYNAASCPYLGDNHFDRDGKVASKEGDNCGKRLSDCKLRFGDRANLPIWAFPGMQRF